MNDNIKKVGLILVIALAFALIVSEGMDFATGPKLIYKEVGHGIPGHGMKAEEKADEANAAALLKQGGSSSPLMSRDDLAGPSRKK
jgi:hypothetical protein